MHDSFPHSDRLRELIDLLDRLRERLEAFVGLLVDEERAIKQWSVDELVKINTEKQNLLEEMRVLEEERITVIGRLADKWAAPSHPLGIGDIAQRAGREDASRLRQLQRLLGELAGTAQERNRYLAVLVGRSLEFFRESLHICRPSSSHMVLYSSSGTLQAGVVETGFIERRE
ncbi:MAG: flagellar protein FlgN [Nitrospiraceae bacterium]